MSNKHMETMASEHDLSGIDTAFAEKVTQTVGNGTVSSYKKIEKGVVTGYKKIEDGVVNGYKKIEEGVVDGFGKVVDKCVEVLFVREGESVEDAKARLNRKGKEEVTKNEQ